VRGDLAARTLTSVHPDAECPSLSPDGLRVAYKKNVATGSVSHWAIAVLDLRSG
jgi:Tol biopolymer transport system component